MPRSEAAKELEAKQKAEMRAEKERKRHSDDPRDWNQLRQLKYAYTETAKQDPKLPWFMIGALLVPVVIGLLIALAIGRFVQLGWMFALIGLMGGFSLAMFLFGRRQKTAAYAKYEGQAGSAELALRELDKKKWSYTPVIALTRQQDCIHRALGPGGLLLIAEGDSGRLKPLLATEVKRHEQVAYGVKVQAIQMGTREGQVPLGKLADHIKKLPATLDATKVDEVSKRLKAMDAMRQRLPIPKGPMPTKGNRSALRGR